MCTRRFPASLGPTMDFRSFVALNRGISCDQADELIENWLKDYRPRTRTPINVLGPDAAVESAQRAPAPA